MEVISADSELRRFIKEAVDKLHCDYSDYVDLYASHIGKQQASDTWGGLALFAQATYSVNLDKRRSFSEKVEKKQYESFSLDECVKALHNCGYSMYMEIL